MNATQIHTEEHHSDAAEIAGAFLRVGAAWARHGLVIARASVETSARTLEVTAGALGKLAKRFEELEHPREDEVVETTDRR